MKTATQLKAKSRDLFKATGTPTYVIQRHYLLERFLERVASSERRDSLVLKGGVLVASIIGIGIRTTRDLDFTIVGSDLSQEEMTKLIDDIISVNPGDCSKLCFKDAHPIMEDSDHPGWRVTLDADFDGIKDMLKLDITADDSIMPHAKEYAYRLLFENRSVNLRAYTLEMILADKFAATVSLGTTNTRMKDYYDAHILTQTRGDDVDRDLFIRALKRSAARGHIDLSDCKRIIDEISASQDAFFKWNGYRIEHSYANDINFADTIKALRTLAEWGGLIAERDKSGFIGQPRDIEKKTDDDEANAVPS